jgi:hypothetical protein
VEGVRLLHYDRKEGTRTDARGSRPFEKARAGGGVEARRNSRSMRSGERDEESS